MKKNGAKLIFFLFIGFYFTLFCNQAFASPCETTYHINFTGQCVTAGQPCPASKPDIDSSKNDLCASGQKCCYKKASDTGTDLQQTSPENIQLQIPLFDFSQANNLAEYAAKIYQYILIVFVPFTIIMIIWGGIQWINARGEANKIGGAKKQITQAFVGLGIGLGSYLILSLVGITQLALPGLQSIQQVSGDPLDMKDLDLSGTAPPPGSGITPSDFKTAQGANPFKEICNLYGSQPFKTVAEKCKALGYGPPPGVTFVKTSDGHLVAPKFKAALEAAIACLKQTNPNATITFNGPRTGYRSPADQYDMYYSGKYPVIAKPCCSNHGGGVAADLSSNVNMKPCMNKQGLFNNVANDAVHWSFSGG